MFCVLLNLPERILPTKKRSEMSKEEAIEWFNRVAEPLRVALSKERIFWRRTVDYSRYRDRRSSSLDKKIKNAS